MKSIRTIQKVLAAILAASMLLGSSAFAAEPDDPGEKAEEKETEKIFISLTDEKDYTLNFHLDEDAFNAVKEKEATWILKRTASYANPEDGNFNPLHGEKEMYPNELDEIVLGEIESPYNSYLKVSEVETEFTDSDSDDGEKNMTLTFAVSPMLSRNNISAPHANGGAYLDVCGTFDLVATVEGETLELDKDVTVEIKPYESFRTMWEIYDELDEIAQMGDDDDSTPVPYVKKEVMGQSAAGYDMPYLIIAKDSGAVQNWLDLCERAETEPEKVMTEIENGTLNDYQVPVVYSNIHSNEVAAVDAVMDFARMLVEQERIEYTKLTDLTEEGEKKLDEQREKLGLHTPELVEDMTTFLGGILPDTSVEKENQNSGKVEKFDDYYVKKDTTINVDKLLDDVFFILVPEENVEGRMYVTRTSSGGYDLNRDNSFQTQAETQNMQHLIATYNPVTLMEFHGQVVTYQVEPCSPPHEPNVEYDLLSDHLMAGGEAFGAAAVANNSDWQSYVIPMRDYLTSDDDGKAYWEYPWDDMSTSYTPQFAMLQGCVAYTVEMPAYSQSGAQADTYGMVGLSDYVAAEKEGYFLDQLEIYKRCLNNENSDAEVGPWLVNAYDTKSAEAELFRPAYDGEDENGQFFPECYIIPLDSAHQTNLQAAYGMMEWLTRNDVKVGITDKSFTYEGETYPAGTMIVSMYQAKRAVANGVLYDGTVIENWTDLYSEGITAFNYTRGFDMVTCAKPAAYKTIAATVGKTYDYAGALAYLKQNAKSQLTGETGGDVIISNASEDSTAAVNALLKSGKKVAMITEGQYEGDFICSYADWLTVKDAYILSGTGVKNPKVTAYYIDKAPTVYISGTQNALKESSSGYVHSTLVSGSYAYNYDRMAMEMMNFTTTEDVSKADAIVGASALEDSALAAVQSGVPYVGYTSGRNSALNSVSTKLITLNTASTDGMDCLGYVTYPEKTLTNASYIADGDDVFYGYGLSYFTSVPEGAKVLVQRDGTKEPLEGFMNGTEESRNAFLSGIQGFSYEGKDQNGNDINITLFANSLTNKAHQRDEYAFISNTIFANLLTEKAYQTTDTSSSASGGSSSSSAGYTVTVKKDSNANGTITVSPARADKGDTVSITVKPDSGYQLSTLTVTDASGKVIALTEKNGKYTFTMPGSTVSVKGTFEKITASGSAFVDVPSSAYYYDAVNWAVSSGVTNGVTATTFGPGTVCTRAQTVTFLWRAAGSPAPASTVNPFTDVKSDAYYYQAVLWAVEQGITKGTTATTFSPDQRVTRGQTVTFLWRAEKSPAVTAAASFTDVAGDAYCYDAVQWAVEQGVTNGTTAATFSPNNGCTRAQIVTMLYRYFAD